MSKNTDIKETVYRIREQQSCLTDQVNLMKADLAKVLREYAKAKIHRYNILTHWLFVAIELYAIIQGLRFMCHEGYPYWMGLSLVYMLAIVIWTTIKKLRNDGLRLDLKTYWDDEDKRLRRSYTAKSVVRMALILFPVLIHGAFVASYLNSIGEINTITGHWELELIILVVLLVMAVFVFGKLYMKSILNIFSEE